MIDFDELGMPEYLDCGRCLEHFIGMNPILFVEACASVGIERGKSTAEMARLYFAGVHEAHRAKKDRRRRS